MGSLTFGLAIGYLGGSRWAWMLGIVFGTINLAGSTVEIVIGLLPNILGIVLSIVTIYYLTRPHVRAFFGKGSIDISPSISKHSRPPNIAGLGLDNIFGASM